MVALALSACHHGGGDDDSSPPPSQATTFTVGGTVTGLNGATVLRLNGANDLNVSASGAFTFSGVALASGASYTVLVASNPAGQSCAVTNAAGTIASANVTNVTVTCFGFSLGGTVTGLTKSGLVLEVNGFNDLPVAPNASSFTFSASTQLGPSFGVYFAGIKTQPTGQTCTIVQAMGVVTAAAPNVSGASGPAVDCVDNVTDSFTGTYSVNDDDHTGTRAYITFFADGTYLLGVRGDDAGCPSNGNGIQYGVYNWNQATQVLEIVKHAAVGLGDECGFDVGTRVTLSPDSEDGTIALIETGGGAPQFVGALA
ncbi:MAG TPA: hypothetical protein VFO94_00435, partial [Gammaproteobacteria bacterium]|nr:hypothetical protein [Gammaproteobacteria bacterium]